MGRAGVGEKQPSAVMAADESRDGPAFAGTRPVRNRDLGTSRCIRERFEGGGRCWHCSSASP